MNKAELLTSLETKFHVVLTPELQNTEKGIAFYLVGVFDLDVGIDAITRQNIGFYVEEEGEAGETAYWSQREPKAVVSPPQFVSDVVAFITEKIGDGTLLAGYVQAVDELNETATVNAYLPGTPPTGKRVLVFRGAGNAIDFLVVSDLTASG